MPWEKVTTQGGYTYTDWRDPLPRIPDILLNSIIYLYPDKVLADTGGDAGGSGFLLGMQSESGPPHVYHMYAITNAHVITGGSATVRVNLKYPSSQNLRTQSFEFDQSSWVIHEKHDLAARAFPHDLDTSLFNLKLMTIDMLMTKEYYESSNIGPGDDIFYVGRFRDHAGKQENLPSVRFGNISMVPNEREPVEYTDTDGRRVSQEGFLVEARSRSGYSGSPVFFYRLLATTEPRMAIISTFLYTKNFKVLGVDWGHINEEVELVHSQNGKPLPMKAFVHAGMMGVVPAWFLEEFIRTSPRLVEQRRRDDEIYANWRPTGSPDALK